MINKKLLFLSFGLFMIAQVIFAQWTDITSSIGGGLTSTTNMAKPYIFDLNNDNYPDFLVPVLTNVVSPYTKYWRLYKNNGNSTFTDATTSYGLPNNLSLSTLGFIDYNGDGYKDLYFYTATGLQIFKNNNGTSFTDVSSQLGVSSSFFTSGEITSPFKVFDYDLDGDEDLLYTRTVSSIRTLTAVVNNGTSFSIKVNVLSSIPGSTTGYFDFSFFDMDNDGDFDIVFDAHATASSSQYSNGITTLYRKDTTGYINTTSTSGLANGLPGNISTIDINQDGNLDIVKGGSDCCTSPLYRVFIGNGTGVFTEQTTSYSISNGGYKYNGTLTDFDNDTDFDFSWSNYTATGAAPFRLYVNNGSNVFTENATTYGLSLGVTSGGVPIDDNGNGVWMDLDKDGDLDIILNREGSGSTSTTGNIWVKRNPLQGNYINIKLNGCGVNKSGIGAKIKLVVGTKTKWLYYEKSPDGNVTNGTDTFHFGLGTATLINSITVYWPNNTTTVLNNVSGNQFLTIGGGAGGSSAPTGNTSQTLCLGSTVANLTATGTNIQWYSTSTGGTALASTTALVNGTTYYVSQTVSGCESTTRLAVTVVIQNIIVPTFTQIAPICSGTPLSPILTTSLDGIAGTWTPALNNTSTTTYTFIPVVGQCATTTTMIITVNSLTPAPTGSATQTLCSGSTVTNITATGTNIKWYATSTGGTALASTTALVNGTTYYASQTVNGCESTNRLAVTVTLNNPTVSATATTICGGSSVSLTASDGNNSQQINNKVAEFSNNVSNMIGISYNSSSIPTNNFSYEFWFNTSRTISLLTEKTGGVSVQAVNGQNFAVIPDFYNPPYYRGTGVSVGTNGISVIEHSGNFFDARLTHSAALTGWHHCAVVYQNNTFSLYLDGNLIGSRSNGTNFGGFGTRYNAVGLLQTIGKGYPAYDVNDNYSGKLDEYRQWSVALTPSQISQIYRRKLQSINMAECNLNLTFDQNTVDNNSITPSGLSLSNTSLPTFTSDNTFQIGGFTGTTINSITNTNFTGTSSSSYSWSTGQTSQTITVIPAQTTQYWVDVTTNGVTCRKYITVNVNTNIAPSINVTTQSSCATPSGSVQITSPISGGITPQNIFISEVTDANAGALSYIELFNKTGNSIDLSNYKIKVYNNGGTTPSCVSLLSGLIANNSTYVIKLSADANQNGIVPNFTLASCGAVNTDDNIRLTTANDVEIDIWGRTDGIAFTPNNQPGYTYRRNSNAILPSTTWSPVDWDAIDPEDYTNIGTYVFPTNNVYNYSIDGGAYQTSSIFTGLSAGNHTITVKDMTTGCTSSTTFTIQSISIIPTGDISQTFCSGATVSNLVANGTNIKWYLSSSGGTALSSSTLLLNNTSYFATQTINGCESQTRLEVKVTIVNVQINTPNTTVCPGGSTTLTATDLNNLSSTNCLNVSAQLQNGLQAFYPFCGNANDLSGNSLNGTVVGATLTSDRFGNLNSAYSFAQNQQINIPNTSGNNTYPLTISLWYNTSTVSDGQGQNGRSIFTKYTPASWNGFGIGLFDYSNEGQGLATAPLYLRNTSNRVIGLYNQSAFNQSNVHFNTWYHVVFTLDSYGGKMYLNGQLISTHNWTGTAGPSNCGDLWKIGGKWNYWFNGKIDDVAVWNRVLSPIEVQEIYETPMTLTSSTYLWLTGETTPTISVSPTQTTQYSVAVTTNGVTCTKYITITVGSSTTAPIGANNQTMAQGSTLANLVVTGQNIVWYSTPFGGTPLPANTPLVNGVTYYASQTINGCESQYRLPVIVQVTLSNEEFDTIKIIYNPNPVIDILNIKASVELKNVKICNLLGQTIFQQRFNSNEIQLNMSDFKTGTYFVIIESDDRKETFKILKK